MANSICHFELMVSDVPRAQAFYAKVFDWRFEPAGPEYTLIQTDKAPFGGMMKKPAPAPAPALNVYFSVPSIDDTLSAALAAGATTIVPRTEVPGMGWFAMFLDPDGIPVGIFEERSAGA